MMSFIPFSIDDLEDVEAPGEYLFVLDRSGSMSGSSITLAKDAAIVFVKSLPKNSLFNIISFGSGYEFMFPESVKNNEEGIENAIENIKKFEADLGGTKIYQPLK